MIRLRPLLSCLALVGVTVPLDAPMRAAPPADQFANPEYNGRFSFTRIQYFGGGFRGRGGSSWAHDWPDGDINMQSILDEVTALEVNLGRSNVFTLDDPAIFQNPIIYISEPGYWRMSDAEVAGLPALEPGQHLSLLRLEPRQHFTQPPPRYTEASLVKELEEKGIGRPSTYAQILSTIQKRGYVQRDRGSLSPTELGETVTDLLVKAFPDILEVAFTAQMEESLDEIEEGDRKWVETVRAFYKPLEADLARAGIAVPDLKAGKPTDETCPKCGEGKLLEKWGRFGRFLACERYPECKYTRNPGDSAQAEPEPAGIDCNQCGKPMVYKRSRFGRFIGCSGYPDCKNIKPITLGIPCPLGCGGEITERRSKRGRAYFPCSNSECKFVAWQRPVATQCPKCGMPFLTQRGGRGKRWLACAREGCDYRRAAASA